METKNMTASSGNVFTDLGFAPGEAAVMALRADLMGRLRLLVQAEGWTQAQAAEHFGIAQSRVSDLVRGKWDRSVLTCSSPWPHGQGTRWSWRWPDGVKTTTPPV